MSTDDAIRGPVSEGTLPDEPAIQVPTVTAQATVGLDAERLVVVEPAAEVTAPPTPSGSGDVADEQPHEPEALDTGRGSGNDDGAADADDAPRSERGPSGAAGPTPDPNTPTRAPSGWPRRLFALLGATAALVAAGLFALTFTSFFAADAIRVRGIHHLTKGQILRLSGLERGVNVFHLDAAAVEERVEADPWVAGATLTKDLPSTVILTIHEQAPVAVVNDGSIERLVGEDGGLLGVGAPSNLPRIVAEEGATTADLDAVRGAARAVSAMRPEIRRMIAFVVLLPEGELALELRSGVPVAYGAAEDEASKAQALAAMIRYAERTGGRYISMNVSVPTAPAGTLIGGSEPA